MLCKCSGNVLIGYKDSSSSNPFTESTEYAISTLTLPHSNADVERVFSNMNIIKSILRNKIQLEILTSLLVKSGLKRHSMTLID